MGDVALAEVAAEYERLERRRWPNGVRCPLCDGDNVYLIGTRDGVARRGTAGVLSGRRTWACRPCRRQFSATTGTTMHGARFSLSDDMKSDLASNAATSKHTIDTRWLRWRRDEYEQAAQTLDGELAELVALQQKDDRIQQIQWGRSLDEVIVAPRGGEAHSVVERWVAREWADPVGDLAVALADYKPPLRGQEVVAERRDILPWTGPVSLANNTAVFKRSGMRHRGSGGKRKTGGHPSRKSKNRR